MSQRGKTFLSVAVFVVAAALFAVVAHFRARSAAEQFKARLRAQGEKLSIAELTPLPPVGVANGARDFLDAQSRLTSLSYEVQPGLMKLVQPGRARVAWMQPELPAGKSSNVWPELRAYFETNRSALANMRAALDQPGLWFQVNYQQGFSALLPHLAKMKSASQVLSAVAVAAMRDQHADEALASLQALVVLPARFRDEPFMISQLVRYAIVGIAVSTTWEALHYPGWSDDQLARLQSAWEKLDVLTELDASLGMERACLLEEYAKCREATSRIYLLNNFGGKTSNPIDDLGQIGKNIIDDPAQGFEEFLDRFPRRWVWKWWNCYKDEVWFLQRHQSQLNAARRVARFEPFAPIRKEAREETARVGDPPRQLLMIRHMGVEDLYMRPIEKAVMTETQKRIVVTAIALKRYERRHGKLAQSLSALVPELLPAVPADPQDRQPLRYRTTGERSFLLYSVGADGKDDAGDAGPIKPSPNPSSYWWLTTKDWVWPSAATESEVRDYHQKTSSHPFSKK